MHGMPCHRIHLLLVRPVRLQFAQSAHIKELDYLILAGCQEPVPIPIPLYIKDIILVSMSSIGLGEIGDETEESESSLNVHCGHIRATLGIPKLDQIVLAARGQDGLLRMPMNSLNIPTVACQRTLL